MQTAVFRRYPGLMIPDTDAEGGSFYMLKNIAFSCFL